MIHRILHIGEGPLRKVSEPIVTIDDTIRALVVDMFETMRLAKGCGLAAPQIGHNIRLVVIDVGDGPCVMVNPRILRSSGKEICEEGCLSLPGLREKVQRMTHVTLEAEDTDGKTYIRETDGLLARVIQHEIDHLDGVLFVDRISKARRLQIRAELEYLIKGGRLDEDNDEGSHDTERLAFGAMRAI